MKNIIFMLLAFLSVTAVADEAKLTWLGHSAFVYKTAGGTTLLIDPWLTNPKAPKDYKLGKIDAILISHGHFDHVGEAFSLAKKNHVPVIASFELTEIAKKNGAKDVMPLNQSGSQTVGKVTITAVQATHSSSYQDKDKMLYAGAPLGFIIEEAGSPTLYHAGDTGVFGDMTQIKSLYHPDVALLPIGGVYVMKPKEAALATRLLGVKAVVPMHYGTFPALAGTPEELQSELKGEAGVVVKTLVPGQEVVVTSLYK